MSFAGESQVAGGLNWLDYFSSPLAAATEEGFVGGKLVSLRMKQEIAWEQG